MAPPNRPLWLDNNILVRASKQSDFEAELTRLQSTGNELLMPKSVEIEFLYGQGFNPADTVTRKGFLARTKISVDTMSNQVAKETLQAWRQEGIDKALSITDADIIAQVRASAQVRGIKNPVFLTRDVKSIATMRQRGVLATEFKPEGTQLPPPEPPAPSLAPKPSLAPVAEADVEAVIAPNAFRVGLRAVIGDIFSAPNIASMIPIVLLAYADIVAMNDTKRKVEKTFAESGFAKGFAAGLMGWAEEEVVSKLLYRVTSFRVRDMADPAGFLPLSYILQLAEAYEEYGVAVGFQFSRSKTAEWKQRMRDRGFKILKDFRYHFPDNPEILFEYDFIDKLANVLRPTTDAILAPAWR
jgi:hypothetical protein